MGFSVLHRRFSAWLALLALLLGALAPVATQAVVAGSERAGWVQICSASGMAWVQLDAGEDGPRSDNHVASGCTWCTGHVVGGLPPAPAVWVAAEMAGARLPQEFVSAVVVPPWAPAQGRAPPAFL